MLSSTCMTWDIYNDLLVLESLFYCCSPCYAGKKGDLLTFPWAACLAKARLRLLFFRWLYGNIKKEKDPSPCLKEPEAHVATLWKGCSQGGVAPTYSTHVPNLNSIYNWQQFFGGRRGGQRGITISAKGQLISFSEMVSFFPLPKHKLLSDSQSLQIVTLFANHFAPQLQKETLSKVGAYLCLVPPVFFLLD